LQHVLVKLGDLITNEPIQAREPIPLLVECEDFQHVELELVSNHSTPGNIKGTNVHHKFSIHDNNVISNNDQNDMFGKALIDIYLLGVSNPKGCVHL